jgi:hypothetical protein
MDDNIGYTFDFIDSTRGYARIGTENDRQILVTEKAIVNFGSA